MSLSLLLVFTVLLCVVLGNNFITRLKGNKDTVFPETSLSLSLSLSLFQRITLTRERQQKEIAATQPDDEAKGQKDNNRERNVLRGDTGIWCSIGRNDSRREKRVRAED